MELTNDQQNALDLITGFLASDEMFFVLKGYAGTGKTTVMAQLIEANPEEKWFATATTHKAAKVLKDKIPAPTSTIHSLLKLKLTDDSEQRHLIFASDKERDNATKNAVVIVDESSMMTVELLQHATDWCHSNSAKMIFVGDIAQLPPIDKNGVPGATSPVWDIDCPQAELTEIMRYGGGIAVLGESIRHAIDREDQFFTVQSDNLNGEGVFKLSQNMFEDAVRRAGEKKMFAAEDEVVVTAYTNARVAELANIVRVSMWGAEAALQYVPGERIVLTSPYKTENGFGNKINLRNRQELRVISVSEKPFIHTVDLDKRYEYTYDSYRLTCVTEDDVEVIIPVISQSSLLDFNENCNIISSLAKDAKEVWERKMVWSQFWKHKGCLCQVAYAYACTTHTSQGSTYNNVIVDVQNIMSLYKIDIKTRLRSLYVACTRARKVLVVN